MLRINNLFIRDDLSDYEILETAIRKHSLLKEDILDWHISKKSIDARKKDDVHYNYSIDIKVKNEKKYKKLEKVKEFKMPVISNKTLPTRPVIVGSGPAGLFAALTLVEQQQKPIIIEQGQPIEQRNKSVSTFLETGKLNPSSNVQFGEGGAGTFSDGKLTTGIHSPFCRKVLEEFVRFGAPEQILYLSKPHIGTDNLIHIMKNMREYMIEKGATFLFETKVTDFEITNHQITALELLHEQTKQRLEVSHVILAIGHSSRETFETLFQRGISMEAKNFSVGVRIEHLQSWINQAQYGTITKLHLPPAEYKLAYHADNGRSCYTFCMCPGGVVMASSSDPNTVVTNGMSEFLRDGQNANAALLVNITPEDFESDSPLAGIYFQKRLEEQAFLLGGSNYFAPVQRLEDFLQNKKSQTIGKVTPTYRPGYTLANLNHLLPSFVCDTLKQAIPYFDTKLHGFAHPDSILTGLETRSSSPVKILRNDELNSNIKGIFPCGEGAGYAGGIMSAAVDGIKCAIALLS